MLLLLFVAFKSNLNVVQKYYFDDIGFRPPLERPPLSNVGFQRAISSNLPGAQVSGDFFYFFPLFLVLCFAYLLRTLLVMKLVLWTMDSNDKLHFYLLQDMVHLRCCLAGQTFLLLMVGDPLDDDWSLLISMK